MNITEAFEKLKIECEELKNKNKLLEEKIKKYTNGKSHKKYYEDHKEIVIKKAKTYLENLKETNPEKLKEYRHRAYLKRKTKLQAEKIN